MNQYILQQLRLYVNHYQDNWSELLPMIDYAFAALPHESTGLTPFTVDEGYAPRTLFDCKTLASIKLTILQEAQTMAHRMEKIWNYAKSGIKQAQKVTKSSKLTTIIMEKISR
jgi:hypothetical protein